MSTKNIGLIFLIIYEIPKIQLQTSRHYFSIFEIIFKLKHKLSMKRRVVTPPPPALSQLSPSSNTIPGDP